MNIFLIWEIHWHGKRQFKTLCDVSLSLEGANAKLSQLSQQHASQIAVNDSEHGLIYTIEIWDAK